MDNLTDKEAYEQCCRLLIHIEFLEKKLKWCKKSYTELAQRAIDYKEKMEHDEEKKD